MQRFTVTEEHLLLLRRMNVGWCHDEFGAPGVDPKRPFGNGGVYRDIADILGIEPDHEDDNGWYGPRKIDRMYKVYRETETVLQIAISVGYFQAGTYEADDYKNNWRLVEGVV